MRASLILLVAAASFGLAGCQKAATSGNELQPVNEAAAANAVGGMESGGAPAATASNVTTGNESQIVEVAFRGCPRIVNVEKPGGCMVLKSGSETYDIDSAQPRPDPGRLIIEGTGLYDPEKIGICQTGKMLTDIKWHPTKMKCPIGDKE